MRDWRKVEENEIIERTKDWRKVGERIRYWTRDKERFV